MIVYSTNPYSATKAGTEELVVAFENTYGLPSLITHTMNVFGERQNPEKFIPMVSKKVRDNEEVAIHANTKKLLQAQDIIYTLKMFPTRCYFIQLQHFIFRCWFNCNAKCKNLT